MKNLARFLLVIFIALSSCKSHQKTTVHRDALSKLEKVYQKYKGVKYRYGGTDKRGFDCSGFVQRAYQEAFQIQLPRTTKAMMKTGKKIAKNELKPGDLVFFHPTRKYYHVGIYMGDGIFMHASSSRGISKSKMDMKYWRKSYVTARRIL